MSFVSVMWPRETGKMETKPGFWQVHKTIEHVGIISRLDGWRPAARKAGQGVDTLEDSANLRPEWKDLVAMAEKLVEEHATSQYLSLDLCHQPGAVCDEEWENVLLRQQHYLLYKELSYTKNEGDIG